MEIYKTQDVVGQLHRVGERLQRGVREAAAANGVEAHVQVAGRPCNLVYVTRDQQGRPSQAFRALFMQELVRHGVLGPSFVVSYSHTDADIDHTVAAVDAACRVYRRALDEGVEKYLVGPPTKPVFRPYC
jgi:glutamate-1-semialdehyde 2,1-aminomutase